MVNGRVLRTITDIDISFSSLICKAINHFHESVLHIKSITFIYDGQEVFKVDGCIDVNSFIIYLIVNYDLRNF